MDTTARLGPYEIKGFLSDVGLDDLYLGRDTRRDVEVVIRVLSIFVDEEAIIERLRRRARKIEALGNPGLLTLARIEKADGAVLAVAPRPEGRALDHFIPSAGLLSRDVFALSLSLCEALAALHDDDHVHGYLHPGRVIVTRDHEVRLLVIGPEEAERSLPPRIASCRPPEVHDGEPVDSRAEVFSLGVLLHLIAAGEPPFVGDTTEELAESIRNDEPMPVSARRLDLPRELAVIIARCLKKDRELRYASVDEVHADIAALKDDIIAGKVAVTRRGQGEAPSTSDERPAEDAASSSSRHASRALLAGWRLPAAGALAILAAFALGYLMGGGDTAPTAAGSARLTQATFDSGPELFPRLSADGELLVYARAEEGDWGIYARRGVDADAVELTADSSFGDHQPALSPDGTQIAFRSERDGGGIFVIGSDGGDSRRLTDSGYNPAWSPDGRQIAVAEAPVYDTPYLGTRSRILVVDADGGAPRPVEGAAGLQPDFSPAGERIAYWAPRGTTASDIWTVPAAGGEPVAVTDDAATDWSPTWSPAGDYLYFASDRSGSMDIWRIPIDEDSGLVSGPAEQITSGGSVRATHPSFARATGTMVYVEAADQQLLYRIPFDPSAGTVSGAPEALSHLPRDARMPDLSTNGERIAFVHHQNGTSQIHVAGIDGSGDVRITAGGAQARSPRLSPGGDRVAYLAEHGGSPQLWMAGIGGDAPRPLTELTTRKVSQPVWSRDGNGIALTVGGQLMPSYTLLFDPGQSAEEQVARTLHSSPSDASFEPHSWSRDGARIAGSIRDRDGRLSGIAVLTVGAEQYEQLTDFGIHPVWLRDGRRLMFQWGGSLYLVDSRSGAPRHVFSSVPDALGEVFSLSSDDRWIYVSLAHKEADAWLLDR